MFKLSCLLETFLILVVLGGCDEELSRAFADMRAAAPDICTDYCVDRLDCEWPASTGDESKEAFSAAIRQCIFECAFYADNGAYVSKKSTVEGFEKDYPLHVDGDVVMKSLECLYDLGVFQCIPATPFSYVLNPSTQGRCSEANDCYKKLKTDSGLTWLATDDGVCEKSGSRTVEAPYF
ncbi:MAG: hypothetical protein GY854_07120 [Deltaproteobacteria bacterium]|nr:hypothetical protein [Deltaproteobacteria bacterium]